MNSPREPLLTLPGALTALIAVLVIIHLARQFLTPTADELVLELFAFVPARYGATLLASPFPGGFGAKVWTFVTYALLHGDWSHIGFNVLWLLPFGSAVARRFGAARFFAFMIVTAAAGALAHLIAYADVLTRPQGLAPMIGASAAVSGTMAAATRFAFMHGSFLSLRSGDADAASKVPALPLLQSLRNGRVLAFVGIWFASNLIFGIGSMGVTQGTVAWQAHIGGFVAGLLLFSLFDPVPPAQHGQSEPPQPD